MTPLQVVVFFIGAPFATACLAMCWFVIRDAFDHPNVHLLRAEWRDPALLSDDDPRNTERNPI